MYVRAISYHRCLNQVNSLISLTSPHNYDLNVYVFVLVCIDELETAIPVGEAADFIIQTGKAVCMYCVMEYVLYTQ